MARQVGVGLSSQSATITAEHAVSQNELDIHLLAERDWETLRAVRLGALQESPATFLSKYGDEVEYDDTKWRAEIDRALWMYASYRGEPVGIMGSTNKADGAGRRYLEYLWVSPSWRRRGAASEIIRTSIEWLRDLGLPSIWLYVLCDNDSAIALYRRKFGFRLVGWQLLGAEPPGWWLMWLDLTERNDHDDSSEVAFPGSSLVRD
jgi:ribosomal protein S18 acetylase RimI-like enzyme